jgi:hypothetical protein
MPGKPKPMLNRPRGKVSDLRKKFNPRTGEETNKPGGVDPRTIYRPKPDVKPTEMRTGGLSPKQKAIASKAPPPDKIDGKDFAVLKAEKAKGRGMGLQDEKIKPGKVQKAFLGKMIKGAGKSVGRLFGRKQSSTATPGAATMSGSGKGMGKMLPQLLQKAIDDGIVKTASKGKVIKAKDSKFIERRKKLSGMTPLKKDPTTPVNPFQKRRKQLGGGRSKLPGKIGTVLGVASMLVPAAYAAAKQYKDYKSAKNRDKAKVKKYSKGMSKEDITREGKRGIAAGKALGESLRDKNAPMKRQRLADRQPSKKMGGGMMQRPMGYKSGTMVKARGCKLGRSKPTKMY